MMGTASDHPVVVGERVRALFDKVHLALVAVVVNATILVVVLWEHRPHGILAGWLGVVVIIAILRALHRRSYFATKPPPEEAARWGRQFTMGSAANGVAWGGGGLALYPADSLPLQVLVVFVIGGMCAGAVTSNASHPPALLGFVVPAMMPISIRMIVSLETVHVAMGAMLMMFSILLIGIGRTASRQLSETVHLRIDGEELAARLATATSELEQANEELKKRASEDVKRLQGALAHSRLLATLGRLATGVAHEVNNPLTYVVSNLEFLSSSLTRATEHQREALGEAQEGTERIRAIISDLASLSHTESNKTVSSDLNRVLSSCAKVVNAEAEQQATVTLQLSDVPLVFGDRSRLSQVCLSVLTNAVQAVSDKPATERRVEARTTRLEDGWVELSVEDDGVGIAEGDLEHVFEPFFTTKPIGTGPGLGLSTSLGIVEGLGGAITIQSEVGKGTTVRVCLMVADAGAVLDSPSDRPSSSSEPVAIDPVRILIIDDDPMIIRAMGRMLHGHRVDTARSAGQAMKLLSAQAQQYEVIFCDVIMPEVTGTELFQRVVSEMPEVAERFVFITGATGPDAQTFLDGIPNRCISKPFAPGELLKTIHRARRRD